MASDNILSGDASLFHIMQRNSVAKDIEVPYCKNSSSLNFGLFGCRDWMPEVCQDPGCVSHNYEVVSSSGQTRMTHLSDKPHSEAKKEVQFRNDM